LTKLKKFDELVSVWTMFLFQDSSIPLGLSILATFFKNIKLPETTFSLSMLVDTLTGFIFEKHSITDNLQFYSLLSCLLKQNVELFLYHPSSHIFLKFLIERSTPSKLLNVKVSMSSNLSLYSLHKIIKNPEGSAQILSLGKETQAQLLLNINQHFKHLAASNYKV